MTHDLKCAASVFGDVVSGLKTFEWRKFDRPFRVGDTLLLSEFGPAGYTGRVVHRRVTYMLLPGEFGLPPGFCIMGIVPEETP